MSKKIFALAFVLGLGLAACTKQNSEEAAATQESTATDQGAAATDQGTATDTGATENTNSGE